MLEPDGSGVSAPAPHRPGYAPPGPAGAAPDGQIKSGRLAGLSMGTAIWVLAWPILIESFLNSLVGLTDTLLSAQLSEAATDAIGGASYLLWFIGLVIQAIGVGATALISRAVGGGRLAVANAAVGQSILLAVVSGVLIGGMVALVAAPAAALLHMNPEAALAFTIYLRILALGVPFTALLYSITACARGAGDSLRPLYAMVIVNVVNILASFTLSGVDLTTTRIVNGARVTSIWLANPSPFHLGVRGIAWGTFIAEGIGAAIVIGMMIRGKSGVRLRAKRLRPHWHTMRRLIRVGIPNFLETFGMWFGNAFVILMVGMLGTSGFLGSHIVAIRIEAFSFLPGFAMGTAAATLAGQYLGAGSPHMARRAVLVCAAAASVVMGLMGAAFLLVPVFITGLISSQPAHLELVPRLLRVAGTVQIPFAASIVFRTALRGAGDVKAVMWLTWITTYGVRLPLAYLLSGVDIQLPAWLGGGTIMNPCPIGGGLVWLWIALCCELMVRCGAFTVRFLQGRWMTIRV